MNEQPPPTPEVIIDGKYRVEKKLGEGGFSKVYKAVQEGINRKVAVKVMKAAANTGPDEEGLQDELIERFRREAEVISQLRSPATVTVHDYGRTEMGDLFMVLEFVDGSTLTDLAPQLPMEAGRLVTILEQILDSLGEAHHFGILHRDIKPGNIMVFEHMGEPDHVKVLDFGIAKILTDADTTVEELTQAGMLVGTPRYIAPELAKGTNPCPASDLYSVGLVCYELLTGRKGVPGGSTMEVLAHQLDPTFEVRLPADVQIPDSLRRVIDKMLSKSVEQRYQSAFEVLEALKALQGDLESWRAGNMDEMATQRISVEEAAQRLSEADKPTPDTRKERPEQTDTAAGSTARSKPEGGSGSSQKLVVGVIVVLLLAIGGLVAKTMMAPTSQPDVGAEVDQQPSPKPGQAAPEEPTPAAAVELDEAPAEMEFESEPEEQPEAKPEPEAEPEEQPEAEPEEQPEAAPEPEAKPEPKPEPKPKPKPKPKPEPKPKPKPAPAPEDKQPSSRTVETDDGVKKVIEKVDGPLFGD